jgi:hypothetical protein
LLKGEDLKGLGAISYEEVKLNKII